MNGPWPGCDELKKAESARRCEKYDEALRWYKKSVILGNGKAIWELANLHNDGAWGLIPDAVRIRKLLETASKLKFEPAMVDLYLMLKRENDPRADRYKDIVRRSTNSYVKAVILDVDRRPGVEDNIAIYDAYLEALADGYSVHFRIWCIAGDHRTRYLSTAEIHNLIIRAAKEGCIKSLHSAGCQFDERRMESVGTRELGIDFSDDDALLWYLKGSRQSESRCMESACMIYFDRHSPCHDVIKGAHIACQLALLYVKYLKASKTRKLSESANKYTFLDTLRNRLAYVDIPTVVVNRTRAHEFWLYGQLFFKNNELLTSVIPANGHAVNIRKNSNIVVRMYTETMHMVREAIVTFMLCYKNDTMIHSISKDIALMIAKMVYNSRDEEFTWLDAHRKVAAQNHNDIQP